MHVRGMGPDGEEASSLPSWTQAGSTRSTGFAFSSPGERTQAQSGESSVPTVTPPPPSLARMHCAGVWPPRTPAPCTLTATVRGGGQCSKKVREVLGDYLYPPEFLGRTLQQGRRILIVHSETR